MIWNWFVARISFVGDFFKTIFLIAFSPKQFSEQIILGDKENFTWAMGTLTFAFAISIFVASMRSGSTIHNYVNSPIWGPLIQYGSFFILGFVFYIGIKIFRHRTISIADYYHCSAFVTSATIIVGGIISFPVMYALTWNTITPDLVPSINELSKNPAYSWSCSEISSYECQYLLKLEHPDYKVLHTITMVVSYAIMFYSFCLMAIFLKQKTSLPYWKFWTSIVTLFVCYIGIVMAAIIAYLEVSQPGMIGMFWDVFIEAVS